MVDPNTPTTHHSRPEDILASGAASGSAPAPATLLHYLGALTTEAHEQGKFDEAVRLQVLRNLVKVAYPSVHVIEHRMLFDRNEVSGTEFVDFTTPFPSNSDDLGGSDDVPFSMLDARKDLLVRDWIKAADDQERLFDELEIVAGIREEDQARATNAGAQQMVMDAEQHRLQSEAIAHAMKQFPFLPPVLTVGEESPSDEWEAIRDVEVGDFVVALDPIDGSTLAQTTGQNYAVIYVLFEEVNDDEMDDEMEDEDD
jgi:hypothetical protein